ncbi:unnamed protein product, partial [Effrenium voratum]
VARPDLSTFGRYGAPLKWDLDLGAEKAKNATQLPLRLRLQPPHGAQSFAASMVRAHDYDCIHLSKLQLP